MNTPAKIQFAAFALILAFLGGLYLSPGGDEARVVHTNPVMQDFMGINVHNVEVNMDLLTPVFSRVRDYHIIHWSLPDKKTTEANFPHSQVEIGWHDRSGRVGHHHGYVNFEKIYSHWKELGMDINASIVLVHKDPQEWNDLEADAYRFGKDFASFFGPNGRGLISSVEIGNEPVPRWNVNDYLTVFKNMARGIRDGDPDIKILTAAAQAGNPDEYSVPINIYRGYEHLFDVIKVHVYSLKNMWPSFERSYPEDQSINYLRILENTIRWRNRHAPDKEIWVTEFGYDASTQSPGPDSENPDWIDVSDIVQAQWLLRSYLEFSRLDLQRAYVFWFNDHDEPSFHASSGIMRLNEPKKSFWTLKQFREVLGKYKFNREVRRNSSEHVYEYVHYDNPDDKIWVAWTPTGESNVKGESRKLITTLNVPRKPADVLEMATNESLFNKADYTIVHENAIELTLSESPVYIRFSGN